MLERSIFFLSSRRDPFDLNVGTKHNHRNYKRQGIFSVAVVPCEMTKNFVYEYLKFFTGYSKSHLKTLAKRWIKGTLVYNFGRKKHKFCQKYFASDIDLLIETDIAHECLSAQATIERFFIFLQQI